MDEFKRKPVNRLEPIKAPENPSVPVAQQPQSALDPSANTNVIPNTNSAPTPAQQNVTPQFVEQPAFNPQPIEGATAPKPRKSKKKALLLGLFGLLGVLLLAAVGLFVWYNAQLAPVDSEKTEKVVVTVVSGTTPTGIADLLKEKDLIRSQSVFLWYTRAEGVQNLLQAGTYRLSPSESTQEIVKHLQGGNVDTFDITFLPGATLAENRKAFINSGYTEAEVDAGLSTTFTSPLFEGKPASADLEGYIYGDTYRFGSDATVQEVLNHVFETYYGVVQKNDLVAKFKTQNLSLYEGITLASIIQRESIGGDEPQIAQVFYKRLAIGMPLGSDVTYQYAADKLGVPRDTNLESPYNTRIKTGLPPGPISVPGINALKAVASPAPGDYIYFLSGDDDVTYYGRTLEEHEANIVNHCKVKCQII